MRLFKVKFNINKALIVFVLMGMMRLNAQERTISTAVPFLNNIVDARSSGLGSLGVATSPDVYAQQWNPAKYIFSEEQKGASISFSPYSLGVSNDVYLAAATFFTKPSERSAWGASFRYFNLGEVILNDYEGGQIIDRGSVKPNELALDLSYSLSLNERFSMSVSGRYIHSNLGQVETSNPYKIHSVAFDIGTYYQGEFTNSVRFRHGAVISNLGPKVRYLESDQTVFIPIQLKLGSSVEFEIDKDNSFSASLELKKMLVPSLLEDQFESSLIEGIFQSFSDSSHIDGGEFSEISWALGAEYHFLSNFTLRSGYFKQSPKRGGLHFFALGTGFKTKQIQADLSYLINVSSIQNQLQNKIRFSVSFPLDFLSTADSEPSPDEQTAKEPTEVTTK
jgi:hypothetical protein